MGCFHPAARKMRLGAPGGSAPAVGAPPGEGGRGLRGAARGAGARQVEPWGAAAAAVICLGLSSVASGAPQAR